MIFENTGIENLTLEQSDLDAIMSENGFVLGSHWDYERITYDRKYEINDDIYYLRIQGRAVDGQIGTRYAVVSLLSPILGQFHFPHTMEYADAEHFPNNLKEHCVRAINNVKESIEKFLAQANK